MISGAQTGLQGCSISSVLATSFPTQILSSGRLATWGRPAPLARTAAGHGCFVRQEATCSGRPAVEYNRQHSARSRPSNYVKYLERCMKFIVRALSVDLTVEPHSFTPARDETVDTANNSIFKDCETIRDVEIAYEDFWNYLNGDQDVHDPSAKVKVLSVTPVAS